MGLEQHFRVDQLFVVPGPKAMQTTRTEAAINVKVKDDADDATTRTPHDDADDRSDDDDDAAEEEEERGNLALVAHAVLATCFPAVDRVQFLGTAGAAHVLVGVVTLHPPASHPPPPHQQPATTTTTAATIPSTNTNAAAQLANALDAGGMARARVARPAQIAHAQNDRDWVSSLSIAAAISISASGEPVSSLFTPPGAFVPPLPADSPPSHLLAVLPPRSFPRNQVSTLLQFYAGVCFDKSTTNSIEAVPEISADTNTESIAESDDNDDTEIPIVVTFRDALAASMALQHLRRFTNFRVSFHPQQASQPVNADISPAKSITITTNASPSQIQSQSLYHLQLQNLPPSSEFELLASERDRPIWGRVGSPAAILALLSQFSGFSSLSFLLKKLPAFAVLAAFDSQSALDDAFTWYDYYITRNLKHTRNETKVEGHEIEKIKANLKKSCPTWSILKVTNGPDHANSNLPVVSQQEPTQFVSLHFSPPGLDPGDIRGFFSRKVHASCIKTLTFSSKKTSCVAEFTSIEAAAAALGDINAYTNLMCNYVLNSTGSTNVGDTATVGSNPKAATTITSATANAKCTSISGDGNLVTILNNSESNEESKNQQSVSKKSSRLPDNLVLDGESKIPLSSFNSSEDSANSVASKIRISDSPIAAPPVVLVEASTPSTTNEFAKSAIKSNGVQKSNTKPESLFQKKKSAIELKIIRKPKNDVLAKEEAKSDSWKPVAPKLEALKLVDPDAAASLPLNTQISGDIKIAEQSAFDSPATTGVHNKNSNSSNTKKFNGSMEKNSNEKSSSSSFLAVANCEYAVILSKIPPPIVNFREIMIRERGFVKIAFKSPAPSASATTTTVTTDKNKTKCIIEVWFQSQADAISAHSLIQKIFNLQLVIGQPQPLVLPTPSEDDGEISSKKKDGEVNGVGVHSDVIKIAMKHSGGRDGDVWINQNFLKDFLSPFEGLESLTVTENFVAYAKFTSVESAEKA
ncbi:hypothetical protein HK100_004907, partial [Physocladia obscura]